MQERAGVQASGSTAPKTEDSHPCLQGHQLEDVFLLCALLQTLPGQTGASQALGCLLVSFFSDCDQTHKEQEID